MRYRYENGNLVPLPPDPKNIIRIVAVVTLALLVLGFQLMIGIL